MIDFISYDGALNRPRIHGDINRVHVADTAALNNTFFNTNGGHIWLEDYVNTGHDVMLLTGWHDYHLRDKARMDSGATTARAIVICRGAWICSRAVVVGPVVIGEHAVVSAGSVVTKDVAPWTMVGGNPAKFIKRIEEKL